MVTNLGIKERLDKVSSSQKSVYFTKTNIYIFQIFKDCHSYFLYGDQAYKSLIYIFGPYLGKVLIASDQQYINKELSCIQMSVEYLFRLLYNLQSLNAYKAGLKLGLQPIAALFEVIILLTNYYIYKETYSSEQLVLDCSTNNLGVPLAA